MNLSFFAIQNAITLGLYSKYAIQVNLFMPLIFKFLDIIGTSFSCLLGLFFVNYLFGIQITKFKKVIYIFIFAFQIIGLTIYYWIDTNHIFQFIIKGSIIFVIIYELLIVLKNYKEIKSKELRKAIKFFMLITLLFFPFIILESFRSAIEFIKNIELLKILALPSYFLVLNIFNLIFTLTYFNTPTFITNNKLTDYFIQKYDITEKQAEVIELIMEGITYKQIAEKLFISSKTVDNHIQNIYKKLNVKSKMQLSNFVRSNEK